MAGFSVGGAVARAVVLMAALGLCAASSAATVVLADGTVIHGEIQSLQDGVYTVRTDALGTLRVRKEDVRSIDETGGAASGLGSGRLSAGATPQGPDLDATKSRIAGDPNLLALVLALQNDPDVLAVLEDPAIMKAVAAGDYAALMNDPKIVALMQNEKVRKILDGTQ